MVSRVTMRLLAFGLIALFAASPALAGWPLDGLTVVSAANNQEVLDVLSDGAGGVIVVWGDRRDGPLPDIYTQRINADGTTLWTPGGTPVCTDSGNQLNATAATDGSGGAIVVWEDYRSGGDIYAQRIDASGSAAWATDGILICGAADIQVEPRIIPWEGGGAIVAWFDRRSGNFDVYAQRIDAAGVAQWPADGKPVCVAAGDQKWTKLIDTGAGSIILAWEDYRNGSFSDIYAQRLSAAGNPAWPVDGVAVCTDTLGQGPIDLAPDNAGGAFVAWSDSRSGVEDIYAQHVGVGSTRLWTDGGVLVCNAASSQLDPFIVPDGTGGAIVAWTDFRDFVTSPDVYAQCVNPAGITQWTPDGELISGETNWQYLSDVAPDGAGGAFLAWADDRSIDTDVYMQQVNGDGVALWTPGGEPICAASGYQFNALIGSDNSGCAYVAWTDSRGGDYDVMAMNTGGCAPVGITTPPAAARALRLTQNYPNPFSGRTRFEFELSETSDATIEIFDVRGRRLHADVRRALMPGTHSVDVDGRLSLPAGVYYYRVTAAGTSTSRRMVHIR